MLKTLWKTRVSRGVSALAVTVGAALSAAAQGQAASFNCQHAMLPAEETICRNPNLSRLDEQTAGMYFIIVGSGAPADTVAQVKASQRTFVQTRNACGSNVNCLVDAYTSQMMYLKNVKGDLGL